MIPLLPNVYMTVLQQEFLWSCSFTKWNNDIMTKPAHPPLDLGEALTRNRITTWSGLIVNRKLVTVKSSSSHAGLNKSYNFNDRTLDRCSAIHEKFQSLVCVQYGRVYQRECPSVEYSSYLFAGMFLQPSRCDPRCSWESQYQPWLSIVVYSHQQQFRPLQMW